MTSTTKTSTITESTLHVTKVDSLPINCQHIHIPPSPQQTNLLTIKQEHLVTFKIMDGTPSISSSSAFIFCLGKKMCIDAWLYRNIILCLLIFVHDCCCLPLKKNAVSLLQYDQVHHICSTYTMQFLHLLLLVLIFCIPVMQLCVDSSILSLHPSIFLWLRQIFSQPS